MRCERSEPRNHFPDPIDPGTPGASARREYERRQAKREARIREKHPKLGGLILAVTEEPQSTKAWDTGAVGEERLGERLNELASDTLRVLHDRRIPSTRANIDHIAVTPSGVYVIDPKRYSGRPTLKVEGGLLRPRTEKLLLGGHDRTKLVDGVLKQVDLVRGIVSDAVSVTGVLCFIEADWPLMGGAFSTRGVEVLWPKKLYPRLTSLAPFEFDLDALHRALAASPAGLTRRAKALHSASVRSTAKVRVDLMSVDGTPCPEADLVRPSLRSTDGRRNGVIVSTGSVRLGNCLPSGSRMAVEASTHLAWPGV